MNWSRKKTLIVVVFFLGLIVIIGSFSISVRLGLFAAVISLLFCLLFFMFLTTNSLVKKTNWWNNNMIYTHQFVSSSGYRYNLERNFEIVNVGSNPARFAFIYDNVVGENWSTGTQGLDMDYEILRYFHSYLKKGATVLLPIVPFSSVSGYLEQFKTSRHYIAKFVSILDTLQIHQNKKLKRGWYYYFYPLWYNMRAVRYLLKDVEPDHRLELNGQPMGLLQIEQDARKWIDNWKKEFSIKDLRDELPDHLIEGRKISVEMMRKTILFLQERGYNPIIISPPMSSSLTNYFTDDVKKTYIYSFVNEFKDLNVQYLDYIHSQYVDNRYYFNALFMNLEGRRLFTKQVLKDLNIDVPEKL